MTYTTITYLDVTGAVADVAPIPMTGNLMAQVRAHHLQYVPATCATLLVLTDNGYVAKVG